MPAIALAKETVETLLGFYPPMTASDPEIFIAGLVELLASYSPAVIHRAKKVTNGLPSRLRFLNNIAEIKEILDEWEVNEHRHRELLKKWIIQKLPPAIARYSSPKATATYSGLCELYGVNAVLPGWGAIDMCRAAAKYGSRLQEHIDEALAGQSQVPEQSAYQHVADQAKTAMDERKKSDKPQ